MAKSPDPVRRSLLSTPLLFALRSRPAMAEPGHPSGKLAEIIPRMATDHPRILVTDPALAQARARAGKDPIFRRMAEHVVEDARTILSSPTVSYGLSDGERPSMLGGSRMIIRNVVNCAFAWRWTGDRTYADRAIAEMRSAARFPERNHTHFLDVAETALGVALGYDWLQGALSADDKALIRMALVEKCLLWADRAYKGADDEWLKFPTYSWNWNQVCNGGVLAAALAVAESEPQLAADVIAGVERSLPLALATFAPDGGGPEGPVYWTYGITFHVLILAMLQSAMGQDFGLGSTVPFHETDLYRLWVQGPTGAAFNYGDCGETLSPTSALAWLGANHGHPEVTALARQELLDTLTRPLDGEFDRFFALYSIWFPEDARKPESKERARHFRGKAEIAVFRGGSTPLAAYLGFKAGDNATNHGHQDLGSFVLEGQGARWAIDLGHGSYSSRAISTAR